MCICAPHVRACRAPRCDALLWCPVMQPLTVKSRQRLPSVSEPIPNSPQGVMPEGRVRLPRLPQCL
ncbi:hypothetical protein SNL152K_423 [Streptomyces sp. NL15-2K]|nr:hypothetical protein SNL152K_423 [Streptomyces sp. NL15-2K]